MVRLRRMRTLRKFASVQASVTNHFDRERSLSGRPLLKAIRAAALAEWRGLCMAWPTVSLSEPRPVRTACQHRDARPHFGHARAGQRGKLTVRLVDQDAQRCGGGSDGGHHRLCRGEVGVTFGRLRLRKGRPDLAAKPAGRAASPS